VRVLGAGVDTGADGEAEQVDAADFASDDGVSERLVSGGPPVVVGVARGHHRAHHRGVVCLHNAVDDLVVAAVPADRHHKWVADAGCLSGQFSTVSRSLGRAQLYRRVRQAL
jgi:hypothetical protein